jgi:ribonucleoside-diphosphate reductase alpha chain
MLGEALQAERDLSSAISVCKHFTIATLSTAMRCVSSYHKLFFMRVAMGLATREDDPNARAIEFYQLLSSFDYMSSTPTLFNSGTLRPQLSSCYLTTVPDDLFGIYGAIQDNAMLSKFAGGLGNDWTPCERWALTSKAPMARARALFPS